MAPPDSNAPFVNSLSRNLRGLLVFAGLAINTLFWAVPLLSLALIKLLPVPRLRGAVTVWLMWIGESWVAVNSWLFATIGSIDWRANGLDGLTKNGWYLVISNHQTWVDILVLQKVFNRRIPFLKFFIKQELIWFPVLGLAWWALDMPFMKRHSPSYLARNPDKKGTDLETTRKACEKFRETPTSVINFVEGTRFSEEKRLARTSPYRHLLVPRAGGFAIAMSSMGSLFDAIVDVTLIYPDGPAKFWDLCCGRHIPVIIDVRQCNVDERLVTGDYQSDRAFRRYVYAWLNDAWTRKDELITRTLES